MNLFVPKTYLKLTAVVLLSFSIGLIFFPGFVLSLFNSRHTNIGLLFIQFLGASLVGTSFLNWSAQHFDKTAVRAVYLMNIVSLSPAVIISVVMMLIYGYALAAMAVLLMHLLFLGGFLITFNKIK